MHKSDYAIYFFTVIFFKMFLCVSRNKEQLFFRKQKNTELEFQCFFTIFSLI